jgi:GNAT superfamily N-acetyltransferase
VTAENPAPIRIRPAEAADIPAVVDFRSRMFRELGWTDEARLEAVAPLAEQYLAEQFASGGCSGFVAEATEGDGDSAVVGTVVLVWQRVPPSVRNLAGLQAYALGMYVLPEFRRRGIARTLMTRVVECATEHGAPIVTLHASDEGRPLYDTLGFVASREMRLFTENAQPSAWEPIDEAD